MNKVKKYILVAATLFAATSAGAQTLNSLYFLEGNNQRHKLNPAFASERGGFVTFPLLGNINPTLNSNIGLGTVLYPQGDEMVTFLHPSIPADEAMSKFKSMNVFEFDLNLDILTVGFNAWGGSNTIGIALRSQSGMYVPKGIFQFLKEGQSYNGQEFDIDNLGFQSQNYVEFALGHARKINDKLQVGAKVKFLVGGLYAKASAENMRIYMSDNEWRISERSKIIASSGINYEFDEDGNLSDFNMDSYQIGGYGLGLDLGAVYRINEEATVSLAITDIGFISWKDCAVAENRNQEFVYNGFDNIGAEDNPDGSNDFDDAADELEESAKNLFNFKDSGKQGHTTSLYTTIRAAGEYGLLKNKISFGLLATLRLGTPRVYSEAMVTANFRPASWFNAAINGSFSNVRSSMGATLNFHPRAVNFFIGTDYLLAKFSKQIIPVNAAKFNMAMGLSFNF